MQCRMEDSSDNVSINASNNSCEMHRRHIFSDVPPHKVLSFLTPEDSHIWQERSDTWNLVFRIYAGIFATIYFSLGIMAIIMIFKKDCVRLPVKTFFAVYTTIAVLGFSRFLFFALDPYGLVGFISDSFDKWIILSSLLAELGFPSLVASFSLMFLTLLKIAEASMNTRQWYQQWKFVGPVTVIPYIIAVSAGLIGLTAPYSAVICIIVCEGLFTLWGVFICVIFIFAGVRLLSKINVLVIRTARISVTSYHGPMRGGRDGTALSRCHSTQFQCEEIGRHHSSFSKTTRKITIITFATAVLGIVYSAFSAASLIIITHFVFSDCFGFRVKGNPTIWLAVTIAKYSSEIPLALVMLYSITDISTAMAVMKKLLSCCHCQKKKSMSYSQSGYLGGGCMNASSEMIIMGNSAIDRNTEHQSLNEAHTTTNIPDLDKRGTVITPSQSVVAVFVTTETQTDVESMTSSVSTGMPLKSYLLNAPGDSGISLGSGDVSTASVCSSIPTVNRSTQTIDHIEEGIQTDSNSDTLPPPLSEARPNPFQKLQEAA